MKKDKTEVIFLIDRSGSMSSIKEATEKGLASFVDKQKQEPGECLVSLYEFDDKYNTVYEGKDINDVTEYNLVPRGWTALLDALGFTIDKVGARLELTPESLRPENVIITVMTDGFENRSKEFTRIKIKEKVLHQKNKYNWKFIFLGSNQDAILTGTSYGFDKGLTMTYHASAGSTQAAFSTLSSGVSCLRTAAKKDVYEFSDAEREKVFSA